MQPVRRSVLSTTALRLQSSQARFDLDKLQAAPLVVQQATKSVAFVWCQAAGCDRLNDSANGHREVYGRFDGPEVGQQHGPSFPSRSHATKNEFHRPRVATDRSGHRRRQYGRALSTPILSKANRTRFFAPRGLPFGLPD